MNCVAEFPLNREPRRSAKNRPRGGYRAARAADGLLYY